MNVTKSPIDVFLEQRLEEDKIKLGTSLNDSLQKEMEELIDKYNIEFYSEPKKIAKWGDWRLVWRGKEYYTPYKNKGEWEEAMVEYGKTDTKRQVQDPFKGEAYDVINEILGDSWHEQTLVLI